MINVSYNCLRTRALQGKFHFFLPADSDLCEKGKGCVQQESSHFIWIFPANRFVVHDVQTQKLGPCSWSSKTARVSGRKRNVVYNKTRRKKTGGLFVADELSQCKAAKMSVKGRISSAHLKTAITPGKSSANGFFSWSPYNRKLSAETQFLKKQTCIRAYQLAPWRLRFAGAPGR